MLRFKASISRANSLKDEEGDVIVVGWAAKRKDKEV